MATNDSPQQLQSLNQPDPPIQAPVAPKGMDITTIINSDLDERIRKYNCVVPDLNLIQLDERFMNIPTLTEMPVVSTDFTDDQLLDQPAIMLEHKTDDEIAQIGRVFIPMLSSGFSPQGAAAFLLLAYNLKNNAAGADHAIPEEDEAANVKDMNYTDLSSTILEHATARFCAKKNDIALRVNVEEEARVYTFIAASTLRLFAKPYENYLNAWSHILKGYQRFYGHTIKIPVPQPTATALRSLTHFYTTSQLYKWTLYRILYSGGGTKDAADLKNFLYDKYLTNTGLHIVNIFLRLCAALNCLSTDVTAIFSPEFDKTLSALTTMINLVVKEDDSHKRKMWRYGRLFDEAFMAPLRTKSCPDLTFILAAALKSVSPQTNKDIFNIAQLRDVSAEKRKVFIEVGELLVKYVKDKQKDQVKD
ncbi:hypothetical protein QQ045_001664 [Rhodiola kirilowii]